MPINDKLRAAHALLAAAEKQCENAADAAAAEENKQQAAHIAKHNEKDSVPFTPDELIEQQLTLQRLYIRKQIAGRARNKAETAYEELLCETVLDELTPAEARECSNAATREQTVYGGGPSAGVEDGPASIPSAAPSPQ
jgi:hypothetical protein